MAIEGRDSDPFDTAIAQATLGVDAGLIVYNLEADRARATLVLAPDAQRWLRRWRCCQWQAMVSYLCLAHLPCPWVRIWNNRRIRVNGAKHGGFQIAAIRLMGINNPIGYVLTGSSTART